ncbi:MAG: acyl-CoA dehydrogenase family protein [Cyclobacteriaceae bacterium]|nr:acyl-CoA dehydrogenase family protein [Cyclobacteriaceae bacterium]
MLASPILAANPSLYVFLPILYMVWSDAVLTPTEVKALNDLIDGQKWLKDNEREFLRAQLNPSAPPTPDEFKSWLSEIRKAADGISPDAHVRLVDIGIKMAELKGDGAVAAGARESLSRVEETLGLIGGEALYSFYPEKRRTITEDRHTEKTFDIDAMAKILDGSQAAMIQKVKTIISDKEFAYLDTDNLSDYRERVLKWCKHLADQGYGAMAYPKEFGGGGDMEAYFAIMETLSYHDLSMVIKFGVQFGLWGMSVYFLGTEKHHKQYLKQIGSLELPGCFAMTETGHGSNVKGIETTATYDHATRSFIINTPFEQAKKEYIGNAAVHGQMGTVFAKLIVEG